MTRQVSVEPFPPCEYLQEFMEGKGWTQEDLANVLGRSRQHVNRLLQGKTGITPDTAHELAEAFDTSPEVWMNLQTSYELSLVVQKERNICRRAALFDDWPIREMKKRGFIPDIDLKNADAIEKAICNFRDIPVVIAARKGTPYTSSDTNAQKVWYRRAYELSRHAPANNYSRGNIDAGMRDLLSLAAYPEDARRIPSVLASMGVRFVIVQSLKGTNVDGAALWLDDSTPVVALSLRHDRIDNLWHTLMHELTHIANEDVSPAVDVDMMSHDLPELELRTNEEAADRLIPKGKLDSFINRVKPYYYQSRVVQFAQARMVHPGIVVGQLQYRDEITYQQLRKLLPKVRAEISQAAVHDGWGNAPNI